MSHSDIATSTAPLDLTLTCAGPCGAVYLYPDHLHNVNGRDLCGICRAETMRPPHRRLFDQNPTKTDQARTK